LHFGILIKSYVEADFSTEYWYEKLESAGYYPGKKSLFLWEAVTLYLSETDVRNTLRELKEHTPPRSIVYVDIYNDSLVTAEHYKGMKTQSKTLKVTGEEMGFSLDFSSNYENTLKSFLESENTSMGDVYFMGSKTEKGVFMIVAEIILVV